MVGTTPVGSLRRLDRLPSQQQQEIDKAMDRVDFQDAVADLVRYFKRQEALVEA
jgi:hypothetical protein